MKNLEMVDAAFIVDFVCRCCGACCRIKNGIVRVAPHEISRMAAFLGKSEERFIEEDTAVAPDRAGLILKDGEDGACAMLLPDGRCAVHPVKPDKCRSFPYEWTNPDSAEYCEGLKLLLKEKGKEKQ